MLADLADNLWYLFFSYECICILGNIVLIWLAVTIQNCDSALTLPLALLTFNWELAMRITLCIKGWYCDVNGLNVWYFMNNWGDVVDYDLSIFISLKKQKLSCLFVIVCVYGRYWDLLINLVIL